MKKEEIIELNNKKISNEILEEIEASEDVVNVENLGTSGQYPDCYWFSVELQDGDSIDVFVKY